MAASEGWLASRAAELRKSATATEKRLDNALRKRCPYRVEFQAPLFGYIADFYIPAARLVIEVDGSSHAGRRAQDAARDSALRAQGIETARVTNGHLKHGWTDALTRLARIIDGRVPEVRPWRDPDARKRRRRRP